MHWRQSNKWTKMAVQIHSGLFVGSAQDVYRFAGSILHAARDPWFEDAAKEVVKHSKSYYVPGEKINLLFQPIPTVIRINYNTMALNMVDADDPKYFSDEMVNAGLEFITERMAEGDAVLCHCNMGLSRGPSMAMLWLFEHGFLDDEFRYAVPQFKSLYPDYCPSRGIWEYLKRRCEKLCTP